MNSVTGPLGVNIATVDSGRILLTRREDYDVWCLPGGAVDAGETVIEAAEREMEEETGLEVRCTSLVGVYHHAHFQTCVLGAEPVGGLLAPNYREVTAVGWFRHDDLPSEVMWWYRTRILRALDGAVGEVWFQDVTSPIVSLPRRDAYALRDTSNLSRRSFYETYLSQVGPRNNERQL